MWQTHHVIANMYRRVAITRVVVERSLICQLHSGVLGRRAETIFCNLDIDEGRRMAPGVRGYGSVPLSHSLRVLDWFKHILFASLFTYILQYILK